MLSNGGSSLNIFDIFKFWTIQVQDMVGQYRIGTERPGGHVFPCGCSYAIVVQQEDTRYFSLHNFCISYSCILALIKFWCKWVTLHWDGRILCRLQERQCLFHNVTENSRQYGTGSAEGEPVTWGLQGIMQVLEFSN